MKTSFVPGADRAGPRLVSRGAALADLAAPDASRQERDSHLQSFLQDLSGVEGPGRRSTALMLAPAAFALALAACAALAWWFL